MAILTSNPARSSRFILEIVGLANWEVQKVTLPDYTITTVNHGGTDGSTIKTAGRKEIGEMTLEKLIPLDDGEQFTHAWLTECQFGLPDVYKRNARLHIIGSDGVTRRHTYDLFGVFPTGVTVSDLDRQADENIIETLTCNVDDMVKIK